MKYYLIWILLLTATLVCAQKNAQFSGCWRGTITQDKGGLRPEYGMELYLTQQGDKITGRSFVYFEKYYAEMELEGILLNDNTIQFKETKISAYKKVESMEWCLKQVVLSLISTRNPWRLEGAWQGATQFGPCVPGKIYLKKAIPRA